MAKYQWRFMVEIEAKNETEAEEFIAKNEGGVWRRRGSHDE